MKENITNRNIVEMFASSLQFKESNTIWISQPKLLRNMEKHFKNYTFPQEDNRLALYWHKIWCKQPQGIAKEHLYAYLQEPAYKAAYDRSQKDDYSQRWDKLQEYFQIGFKNQIYDRVLKKFKSNYGSDLKAFALPIFKNSINEELRQGNKAAGHSNWSLLRHSSGKLWKKALQSRGLSNQQIESYLLLRDCFKALYNPETPKANKELPSPDLKTWQSITQLYNKERLNQLYNSGKKLNLNDIQVRLEETSQAIRNYYHPPQISLNNRLGGQEGREIKDIISSCETESLLENIIKEEEQFKFIKLQEEINYFLEKYLAEAISLEEKKCLQLFYGAGLTQAEIAEQLFGERKKQYKISRQLNNTSKKLLEALGIWVNNRETHNYEFDNIVDTINILLKEWLQKYYANWSSNKVYNQHYLIWDILGMLVSLRDVL